MRLQNKYALSALAGVSLIGTLAGCSSTAATTDSTTATDSDTSASTEPSPSASTSTDSGASTATYKDGTYTEEGDYQSPSGASKISVKITLASGVVSAVEVTPEATDRTSKSYQEDFASGISAAVVGKKIDALKVSKVAGSSLTSSGFNAAVKKIEADASA